MLKVTGIWHAIHWLGKRGKDYRASIPPKACVEDRYEAAERSGGGFFPFGLRDYKLRRYVTRLQSNKRYLGTPLYFFQAMLYRFERLNFIAGAFTVIAISLMPVARLNLLIPAAVTRILLYVLTLSLLATNVLLSVEAIFSYATLGGYAGPFHMLSTTSDSLLLELKVLVERVVASIWSGTVAAYVGHAGFQALVGKTILPFQAGGLWRAVSLLWQSMYFATTTFVTVGYGDISPANTWGQVVSFGIELQSFAVIAIVLASLFSSRDTKP